MGKTLATFGFVIVAGVASAAQVVSLRAWIEPERAVYPVNRNFVYVVEATWGSGEAGLSVDVPETPELENLVCQGFGSTRVVNLEGNTESARFHFKLHPLRQENARIGPTYVRTRRGDSEERVAVAAREIVVGAAAIEWGYVARWLGGGSLLVLMAVAGMAANRRRQRHDIAVVPEDESPFSSLKAKLPDLDRLLIDEGGPEFYGRMRELLGEALRLVGAIGQQIPTATEFSAWLEGKDSNERQVFEPCLALLEQIERVRFAGWHPTPEENRCARRELEMVIETLSAKCKVQSEELGQEA